MSKSLRNYRSPQEIFDLHGADALRWYFFANQAPWNSIIYSERAIKESIPEFLLRLWNVYSFFVIYANIDGFDPSSLIGDTAGELAPSTLRAEPPIGRWCNAMKLTSGSSANCIRPSTRSCSVWTPTITLAPARSSMPLSTR